ncbi:MAG: hypothetical protein ACRDF8_06755, partial [Chloroflexota bacterium]
MSIGEWLRFAQLSLVAGWLAALYVRLDSWRVLRTARPTVPPARHWRWVTGIILLVIAGLALAQLVVDVSDASDPLTPIGDVVSAIIESAYGGLSLALLLAATALAVVQWRLPRLSGEALWGAGLVLLLGCGAAALTSGPAIAAAASAGDIVMSPTLVVPRDT